MSPFISWNEAATIARKRHPASARVFNLSVISFQLQALTGVQTLFRNPFIKSYRSCACLDMLILATRSNVSKILLSPMPFKKFTT